MVNEDGETVTDENVKLGSKIRASIESTLASDRLGLYAKECSITEGDHVISIIKNGCYSSAVGATYVNKTNLKLNQLNFYFLIEHLISTTAVGRHEDQRA